MLLFLLFLRPFHRESFSRQGGTLSSAAVTLGSAIPPMCTNKIVSPDLIRTTIRRIKKQGADLLQPVFYPRSEKHVS
jgi:hypothetical protein